MKFIDEARIEVLAGKGGDGCAAFRREKYVPRGGPSGGDGGKGGSVWAVADRNINTLVEFRYTRKFLARNGQNGMSAECYGAGADDITLRMPVGTVISDYETGVVLHDLNVDGKKVLVAQGGKGGLGNIHFKSSVNRAPRQFTRGTPGEERMLKLELKVLADVGLLGLPNAGKSTFIRSVSAAKPKVADYPFTTLHPNLGVVRTDENRSFVIADIPGVIEGAAEGAGLGHRFLRHLARTRLIMHLVDLAPFDPEADPVHDAIAIAQKVLWRAETPVLLEIKIEGSTAFATPGTTYSVPTLLIKLPIKWSNFEKIGEANGNDIVQGSFFSAYDPTAAVGPSFVDVVELATVP